MINPAYHEFEAPETSAKTLADLPVLDIIMRDPAGSVCYWPDECGGLWKEIGRVTVNIDAPRIELWPYAGQHLSRADLDTLRGSGIDAWQNPPSTKTHWTRRTCRERGAYWETVISVPALHQDPRVRIIRAGMRFRARQNKLFNHLYVAGRGSTPEFDSAA